MKLYNNKNKSEIVSFKEALFKGAAGGGGLYVPVKIPLLSDEFWKGLNNTSFNDICFEISSQFLSDEIPSEDLRTIINNSINFDAPLISLTAKIKILELFHGPTLAFKDFGARFMAEVFEYFKKEENKETYILVATSGDTGSAVANAFFKKTGIKVILLYPSGKISNLQEKQFTTLGENITALEIEGTFDDCQSLVKKAFIDKEITDVKNLSSANSINIGRLLPQTFYYFRAIQQLKEISENLKITVPSGNLGNLTAGLIAKKMGLPVNEFISATNINSVFADFLSSGNLAPRKSVITLSNAMDVGNPNNYSRITEIFDNSFEKISNILTGYSIDDEKTLSTISKIYNKYDYILDPHGAVGFAAMEKDNNISMNIILETAHPAKFNETIKKAVGKNIELPHMIKEIIYKEKKSIRLKNNFEDFKSYLLNI